MSLTHDALSDFLANVHPYDALETDALRALAPAFRQQSMAAGQEIYALGQELDGLYLIREGAVEVRDANGAQISQLGPRNSFGERGLSRDGIAVTAARTLENTELLVLPRADFLRLVETEAPVRRFFDRDRSPRPRGADLATSRVETLMTRDPLTCGPDTSVQEAAALMQARHVSSICVLEGGRLAGIVTLRDLSGKVVAAALPATTPIREVMTAEPLSLSPSAIGSDVLHLMMERRIGHIPVTEGERLLGIVTQTDLTRFQATHSADLVADIARAKNAAEMARATARIPRMLVQLVGSGHRHDVVTRLITDIADAATRRLLALAEDRFGPAPVPYVWLACGSQGRREQTGVSDQDNCLVISDTATAQDMAWFEDVARYVCNGLDVCGYVFCPGDMMATNPRWRQPLRVWRDYFRGWIDQPGREAQMLASVMFDLRPIGGDAGLFETLQTETLEAAARNSIFVAHMISNAVGHSPPLGLLRGFATIRSGVHKNRLDMKLNGVVPVVDLARIYALKGRIASANTRVRLETANASGHLSLAGGQDLLGAYDLIAETRLLHQARQIRTGQPPDNFMAPADISDFDRSHLRDAFVVVKSQQAALGFGKGALG